MLKKIKIVSRSSHLARVQAYKVGAKIQNMFPTMDIEYCSKKSEGDVNQNQSISSGEVTGLFTHNISNAISNGEYDILVKGVEQFKVIKTRMEGETVIGEIDYLPLNSDGDEQLRKNIQELYLQVLIKVGISNSLEMHMEKKISYEFLQGFELPLNMKKKLILMNSENKRLSFIKDVFVNILESDIVQKKNMPSA